MKGRTTWVQVFPGSDGKDRLVMTYNRYGGGAPKSNNLRVNGYDYNGIFVAGALMARFWREPNGDLVLSQPTCKNGQTVHGEFAGLSMTDDSWRRLVAASNPDAYSPSEYEWTNLGPVVSVMSGSTAIARGPMFENYGNVNEFVARFSISGDGETRVGIWDYGHVNMMTRTDSGASIGWRVKVKVDEAGFLKDATVESSWDEIERTHSVGGIATQMGEPAPWSDWETRRVHVADGGNLVEVRQVTFEDR